MRGALMIMVGLLLSTAGAEAKQPSKRPTPEELGRILWVRHCRACHGELAHGDGPATEALVAEVPDLYKRVTAAKADELARMILRGREGHPSYSTAMEGRDDAEAVINYLVTLDEASLERHKQREAREAQAEDGEEPDTTKRTAKPPATPIQPTTDKMAAEAARRAAAARAAARRGASEDDEGEGEDGPDAGDGPDGGEE